MRLNHSIPSKPQDEHQKDDPAFLQIAYRRGSAGGSAKNLVFDFLLGHPLVSIRQVQEGFGLGDFKTA